MEVVQSNKQKTQKGKILWYDPGKGYGYIRTKDKEKFFFHANDTVQRYNNIQKGHRVTFELASSNKHPVYAINVAREYNPENKRTFTPHNERKKKNEK